VFEGNVQIFTYFSLGTFNFEGEFLNKFPYL